LSAAGRALRNLRLVHTVFLLTVVLYIVVIGFVPATTRQPQAMLLYVFAAIGFSDVLFAFLLRSQLVTPPAEALRVNPDDAAALQKWRSGNLISFVLAETLALLGLVLKFLGFGWNIAGVFFAVSIALLMLFTPKLELETMS
jgi:hypothetical protein